MSAFDAQIRVGEASVGLRQDEKGDAYEGELVLGVMAATPLGPGQVLPIPLGVLRVPLDKQTISGLIDALTEARDQMKDRPNIAIASSLEGVDKAAQFQQGLK